MDSNAKTLVFWLVLVAVAVLIFAVVRTNDGPKTAKLTYSQFLQEVQDGHVAGAIIEDGGSGASRATLQMKDGKTLRTVLPPDYRDAMNAMQQKSVNVELRESSGSSILWNASPFVALLILWFFMMWKVQQKGKGQPGIG